MHRKFIAPILFCILLLISSSAQEIAPQSNTQEGVQLEGYDTLATPFYWGQFLAQLLLAIQFIGLLAVSIWFVRTKTWLKVVGLTSLAIWLIIPVLVAICALFGLVPFVTNNYNIMRTCFGDGFVLLPIIQLTVFFIAQTIILFIVHIIAKRFQHPFSEKVTATKKNKSSK
ncbi:MAG: hypothetical protein ACMXYE_02695 [Candidatus Woesearchaeota archaeon]